MSAGVAKSFSVGEVPGLDGVLNLALTEASAEFPYLYRSVKQKCFGMEFPPEV